MKRLPALLLVGLGLGGAAAPSHSATTASVRSFRVTVYLLIDGQSAPLGVRRTVMRRGFTPLARLALEQLLGGPGARERAQGLTSAIPAGAKIRSFSIVQRPKGSTATVDLAGLPPLANGASQESGLSATEEEFDEARRRGKPILVLRQERELEPEQQEFLDRATGGWEGGAFYGIFRDASDVGLAVVRGLTNIRDRGARATLEPAAQERAAALAADAQRQGYSRGGSMVRVVLVPLIGHRLLEAAVLEDPELPDGLAGAARSARLVPQSEGIRAEVSAAGILLQVGERYGGRTFSVGTNGEIVVEASVAGEDQSFGSMRVVPDRLEQAIRGAVAFAASAWQQIDPRGEVQEVAVTLAIPEAQHKSWGRGRGGNTRPWLRASLSRADAPRLPHHSLTPSDRSRNVAAIRSVTKRFASSRCKSCGYEPQSSRRRQYSSFRSTSSEAATRIAPPSSSSQCACGFPSPYGRGG